jgi:hypothetical protein
MRIGELARGHDLADKDMWHALRNAIRQYEAYDDNMTMLIGPATNGALLEIGVLDIEGDDP